MITDSGTLEAKKVASKLFKEHGYGYVLNGVFSKEKPELPGKNYILISMLPEYETLPARVNSVA